MGIGFEYRNMCMCTLYVCECVYNFGKCFCYDTNCFISCLGEEFVQRALANQKQQEPQEQTKDKKRGSK